MLFPVGKAREGVPAGGMARPPTGMVLLGMEVARFPIDTTPAAFTGTRGKGQGLMESVDAPPVLDAQRSTRRVPPRASLGKEQINRRGGRMHPRAGHPEHAGGAQRRHATNLAVRHAMAVNGPAMYYAGVGVFRPRPWSGYHVSPAYVHVRRRAR